MHSLSDRINQAFEREDWASARRLLRDHLRRDPDDHWLHTRLSTAYFEERKYAQAMKHVKKALELAPDCPLVLWDYAGGLLATGKVDEALATYKKIIAKGQEVLTGPHSEGVEWGCSLLLDCIFTIGVCYQNLGEEQRAADVFQLFIGYRARWSKGGIHSVDDAVKRLSQLKRLSSSSMAQEVGELSSSELIGA